MEKMKSLDFSENFVACDVKVGRYKHHIELMKLCDHSRSRTFRDLDQRSFIY